MATLKIKDSNGKWQEVYVNGKTPTIGPNGNWFLDGIDTGKPSKGKDGVSLTDVLIQEQGNDEYKIMSQKAVTDALKPISNKDGSNGMARVNLPEKPTLMQSDFPTPNTIYVVQYNYNLGEDITIPDGCVLKFEGGSLNGNRTLTFRENSEILCNYQCFINFGNIIYNNKSLFNLSWIGAKENIDCGNILSNLNKISASGFLLDKNLTTSINNISLPENTKIISKCRNSIDFTSINGDFKLSLSNNCELSNIDIFANESFKGDIILISTEIENVSKKITKPNSFNLFNIKISQKSKLGQAVGLHILCSNKKNNIKNYITNCRIPSIEILGCKKNILIEVTNYPYSDKEHCWINDIIFGSVELSSNEIGIEELITDSGIINPMSSNSPYIFGDVMYQANNDSAIAVKLDGKVRTYIKSLSSFDNSKVGILKNKSRLFTNIITSRGFGIDSDISSDSDGDFRNILGIKVYSGCFLNLEDNTSIYKTFRKEGFNITNGLGTACIKLIKEGFQIKPEEQYNADKLLLANSDVSSESITAFGGGLLTKIVTRNITDYLSEDYGKRNDIIFLRYRPEDAKLKRIILPYNYALYFVKINDILPDKYYSIILTPKFGDFRKTYGNYEQTWSSVYSKKEVPTSKDFTSDLLGVNSNGSFTIVDYKKTSNTINLLIQTNSEIIHPFITLYYRHSKISNTPGRFEKIPSNLIYNDIYINEVEVNIVEKEIRKEGTTDQRPTEGIKDGFQYWDTTIQPNRYIWKHGNKWVDGTGKEV